MFEEDPDNNSNDYKQSPIFIKAQAIQKLAMAIADLADKSPAKKDGRPNLQQEYARYVIEDATIIAPKIAGVWKSAPYDLKMENATIIRKAARELSVHMTGLEMDGFKEIEYCDLLRVELEEFRILFAEWVKTFDPWDYYIDRWGLFNPPGVNYDDHDPEDDIPFDLSELLNFLEEEDMEDEDGPDDEEEE